MYGIEYLIEYSINSIHHNLEVKTEEELLEQVKTLLRRGAEISLIFTVQKF